MDFFKSLGRLISLVVETGACAYVAEKGRQWAEKSFPQEAPTTMPAEDPRTDRMKELTRSANGDPERLVDEIKKDLNAHQGQ